MLTVAWQSGIATRAEVWRVLDLSGITNSVRESKNFLRAGYVYVDQRQIFTMTETVEVGCKFLLELRFPNGIVKRELIFLVQPSRYKPRINTPDTPRYKP